MGWRYGSSGTGDEGSMGRDVDVDVGATTKERRWTLFHVSGFGSGISPSLGETELYGDVTKGI